MRPTVSFLWFFLAAGWAAASAVEAPRLAIIAYVFPRDRSAVDFVKRHDLDGFDVDWEYPGLPGDGNTHRPEDKENFTALMAELRAGLDREGARRGKHLLLTFAAGASSDFLAHTEMAKVQAVVDFVNLMTYDFRVAEGGEPAGHHANLYPSPADPSRHSADGAVAGFLAAGVPASKLVLGVPFYGRAWRDVEIEGRALPPGEAARGADGHVARGARGPGGPRGMGARVGRGGAGVLPLERGARDVRHVRGRGVAAPQEPVRARSRPGRRHVLGVPRRPHRRPPRHARGRSPGRRGHAALRRVALRPRSRRRGARFVLGAAPARGADQAPGRTASPRLRRRRHRGHAVDGPDRGPLVLHLATVRVVSPARKRQGAVLAAAGQALRRARLVRARRRSSRPTGRAAASSSTSSARTGRRSRGSTESSSARATASRRRTSTTSARGSRPGRTG